MTDQASDSVAAILPATLHSSNWIEFIRSNRAVALAISTGVAHHTTIS
jgi:hypothetical protein